MSCISGSREQISMLPPTIEEYVNQNNPVRAYDAFIEAIDLSEFKSMQKKAIRRTGRPNYDPKVMIKLFVYSYSYGWRSSRKIERALHNDLTFIWLTGGLKPDHKTIANFRKDNESDLKKILKLCAQLCLKLNLIDGNHLFLDGSKIRGNASINQTKSKKKWEEICKQVEERIDTIFEDCKKIDQLEGESGSYVKLSKELQSQMQRKAKIENLIKKMEDENLKKINGTDPESINFKSRQGSHAGFNAQSVVDGKNGLIVHTEVVSKSNDLGEFTSQIDQAHEVLGKESETSTADAGYADVNDLKESLDKGNFKIVVPSQRQALHSPKDKPFSKDKFKYNKKTNEYTCPEGKVLVFRSSDQKKKQHQYRMQNAKDCKSCPHFGQCTSSKTGRTIKRLFAEETKEQLEAYYASDEGQAIYKNRKSKVELPFGHIKRNLQAGYFLMRGKTGVNAEMSILANCFNVARMITLLGGVQPMVQALQAVG